MGEKSSGGSPPPRHSASADAAALRWSETHPDEDVEHAPASPPPEPEERVPNRHSASAEAAAVRWRDAHADGDGDGEGTEGGQGG
jgi:hypothetical protein